MAGAMTRPSQDVSRVSGGGHEPTRSPVVPQLDEDPFNRDKNPKRRKTEAAVDLSIVDHLVNRVCARFGLVLEGPRPPKGSGRLQILQEPLSSMCDVLNRSDEADEADVMAVMEFLSLAACVVTVTASFSDPQDTSSALVCGYCNVSCIRLIPERRTSNEDVYWIYDLMESVVSRHVPSRGPLAVRALIFSRRMVLHSMTDNVLRYERCTLFRWCVAQLYSPDKAVRAEATKTLAAFAWSQQGWFWEQAAENRKRFYYGLDRMFASGNCAMQETSLLAWTQLGMAVSENELEPMLQGLLRHLDSTHKPIRDMVISELRYLASYFGRTLTELFEPYWRSTAYLIIKHVADRPAVVIAIANLFGTSARRLVLRLQAHAIPDMLFRQDLAPISEIAKLRGDGDELWPTLIDKANLTSILAFWVQLPPDVATLDDLMVPLQQLSARLGPASIREVMGAAAIPVLAELFIRLTYSVERIPFERVPDRFERISDGIGFHPILTIARLLKKDAKAESDEHLVTEFLSQHVLGLTTCLSDVHVYEGKKHLCHWINGIEALEMLIKYLRSEIRTARPQVTSFLLDALCNDGSEYAACWRTEVRRAAISCWATLVRHVGDENVTMLVETTFAVIRKNWDQFDYQEKDTCQDLLEWLLAKPDGRNHRECLLEKIDRLPNMDKMPDLQMTVRNKLKKLRHPLGVMQTIDLFAQRIMHENLDVVWVALEDARVFLESHQEALRAPAQGEKSDSAVAHFVRALLDCAAKYSASEADLASRCLRCIGLVGCLDANRLGAAGKEEPFVVIYQLQETDEALQFVMYMLQHVLTRAFLSATNATSQGLIAYAVQTLLSRCGVSAAVQSGGVEMPDRYHKWKALPELVQVVLSPLLVSKYHIAPPGPPQTAYPLFRAGRTYGNWLRMLVADLLAKPQNVFGEVLYESLARAAKGLDLAVAEFLLPYLVVFVVTGTKSTEQDRALVAQELQQIAAYQPPEEAPAMEREQAKLFYDAVFRVIEYVMVWLRSCVQFDRPEGVGHLEKFLEAFPAEVLSQRAIYCRDYARAMFFLEPVAMGTEGAEGAEGADEAAARRDKAEADMIDIYAQIDDPDCLSGIMSKVGSYVEMDTYRKALLEQKAGRWESATTWYLSELSTQPESVDIQARVLTCLLEAGHHDALLARVDGMGLAEAPATTVQRVLPLAVEAAWATFQWTKLETLVPAYKGETTEVFNVGVASALCHLRRRDTAAFGRVLDGIVDSVAAAMSYSTTSSLQACHETMLKAHVVTDLQMIGGVTDKTDKTLACLVQRLDLLEDVRDKRYVLGLQRAAMECLRPLYGDREISALWLLSARLARKTGSNGECLQAIAQARRLHDPAAEVENARRQWAWGGRHQAIADLRAAISRGLPGGEPGKPPLAARAGLLLTRWLDASGETSRSALRDEYRELASRYSEWEKSHYFLGRHFKKVLESEQALKPDEQSDQFLTGEMARQEIDHYLRAAKFGTKYLHSTLPRFLTVWLELGAQVDKAPDGKAAVSEELRRRRNEVLTGLHKRLLRHVQRLPPFIFYGALPQLVARINHPHKEACHVLDQIIVRVVQAYPQQALWSVFGVLTARGSRGSGNQTKKAAERLLKALCVGGASASGSRPTLQSMLRRGVGLADELVQVGRKGNQRANSGTKAVSLKRDMNFGLSNQSFPFVVPIARCLTAVLPGRMGETESGGGGRLEVTGGSVSSGGGSFTSATGNGSGNGNGGSTHNAFAADVITIHSFQDEVLILGSLAQPRKLTMRGSDGRLYDVLLKPKDDMRTDQRIMEVNGLINEALRKDTEAMRRQLSIRTYAVTPLNEDCGIIEWVLGLKTLREIVRPYYDRRRSLVVPRPPDPAEIVRLLNEAENPARRARVFASVVLAAFPPVLHEWFMRRWPYPAAWFAARLRFTRSAAVMSMVGAVLGLGDRHCENVLVEEGTGGVTHVDFNCLFEKGRLFTQPETVPFRLTQNMRAVMGICDHRGPFRRSCELTLRLLRAQEETLLAVLEAFIHDPTLDLQVDPRHQQAAAGKGGGGGRAKAARAVRLDPPSVVKNIKRRMNGLLLEETIPLGVEGQAWELIKQATDGQNLSAMYIGWAPHW